MSLVPSIAKSITLADGTPDVSAPSTFFLCRTAAGEIVRKHFDRLVKHLVKKGARYHNAEDAVQDLFSSLLTTETPSERTGSIEAFLARASQNKHLDERRRPSHFLNNRELATVKLPPIHSPVLSRLISEEFQQRLGNLLDTLTPLQRGAIVGQWDGTDQSVLARELGTSMGGLCGARNYAKGKLQAKLRELQLAGEFQDGLRGRAVRRRSSGRSVRSNEPI